MLNRKAVVFYHSSVDDKYTYITDICTKLGLSFFDCIKLDMVSYIMNSISPLYLIFDAKENFDKSFVEDFGKVYPHSYVLVINCKEIDFESKNCLVIENSETLFSKLNNHYKFFLNHMIDFESNSKLFYNYILLELDKLCFRSKLIGSKYLTDLIYELYLNSNVSKNKCCVAYEIIAKKYNINTSSIERAIRFAISKAYENCPNKQLFLDISKTDKLPSIKELANYIINKLIYILGNSDKI